MRRVARQKDGWQGRRPADGGVTHCGVAHQLSLRFLLPIGMGIMRGGSSELQFSSVTKDIHLGRCRRCVAKRGRKPQESSHRLCAVAIGRYWHPSGPTRRQEQGSRRWADPTAAGELAAGC